MKIPMTPPKEPVNKLLTIPYMQLSEIAYTTTPKGDYIHWDKLRHLTPPKEFSVEDWWFAIKLARKLLYKQLPFTDRFGKPFVYATPDIVLRKLNSIDRNTGNTIQGSPSILNTQMRDTYLVQSLIEEAITSSQLEGASTTRQVAKEMLRTKRKPQSLSEKMIFNNYRAMQFVREIHSENLSVDIILELHRILTQNTLEDPREVGHFRKTDDVHVWDNTNQILHTPPEAHELNERLRRLCQFANMSEDQNNFYIHPVIKAIILHFMLAYDHPFIDGNGRTARALFYWSMIHQGYWLAEFISISEIIKRAPRSYAQAYLYTETDDNDMTYFIIHQLDVITKAINTLYQYIETKSEEISETEQLINTNSALKDKLNYRQIALLKHALKHPNMKYKIEGHKQSHNVTYDTARTDLLNLAKLKLLEKSNLGKAFIFIAPKDLKQRIRKIKLV